MDWLRLFVVYFMQHNTAVSATPTTNPPAPQHSEIKELMTNLHDRVGVLATLDEDQRHRLEVIDKKWVETRTRTSVRARLFGFFFGILALWLSGQGDARDRTKRQWNFCPLPCVCRVRWRTGFARTAKYLRKTGKKDKLQQKMLLVGYSFFVLFCLFDAVEKLVIYNAIDYVKMRNN